MDSLLLTLLPRQRIEPGGAMRVVKLGSCHVRWSFVQRRMERGTIRFFFFLVLFCMHKLKVETGGAAAHA
jgi:hypothetical protein